MSSTEPALKPYHRGIDFDWLRQQTDDPDTLQALQQMQAVREYFIASGKYHSADREAMLHFGTITLATSLNDSYSTLVAFEEIMRGHEHFRFTGFDTADTILDVGANEGLYAIAMCHKNPKATVYCIEANPQTVAKLKRNLQLNGLAERCHVIEGAVWSSKSEQELLYLPHVTTNASLVNAPAKSHWLSAQAAEKRTVSANTLDSMLSPFRIHDVDILKIDIEGSEYEALQGAEQLLTTAAKVVVEYHSDAIREQVIAYLTTNQAFTLVHASHDQLFGTPSCGNLYFARNVS